MPLPREYIDFRYVDCLSNCLRSRHLENQTGRANASSKRLFNKEMGNMSVKTSTLFCIGIFVSGTAFASPDVRMCTNTESDQQKQSGTLLAEIPKREVVYNWSSGKLDGLKGISMAAKEMVSVSDAPWLQLRFGEVKLGEKSYVELSSPKSGAFQRLDSETYEQWRGRSAYFNGDSIQVELYVAEGDTGVVVNVGSVIAGENSTALDSLSICGVDNRVASMESRVARIDPIGCTAWTIASGQLLTAGHCLAGGSSNEVISFNPPPSLSDGTVQFPDPEDQYTIDQGSFDFANGGIGNDWGVFTVFNNSQTGLQPVEAQGSFDIAQDLGPSSIRITGFGTDDGTTNQTNQTHSGPNASSSGTTMRYTADTTGGNSGSPVIDDATGVAVGIHTHGGCRTNGSGNNSGTSFFNSALWSAVDQAPPPPPPVSCPADSIDFTSFSLASYADQNVSNNVSVENGGDVLRLADNTWVRSTQTFSVTPNTVIEFDFASGSQGEIHAIGFDDNNTLNDAARHFQFWGTQNWTGAGKIDFTPTYSGNGNFQSYSIPVGQSYTGSMNLVFTNDNDASSGNESLFACVRVVEVGGGVCSTTEDFESGAGGWTTSGDCTTGTFTTGTPDEVVDGTITTQPDGAQAGVGALYTQPNSGGLGVVDVDDGECIATSPVYSVSDDSLVSIYYFHGQRDAGDDSGDGFALEISTNGGAFSSMVSIGDVANNAAWTLATASVSAGDMVQLRVRAADAAGSGDLVEAGVDSLSICAE